MLNNKLALASTEAAASGDGEKPNSMRKHHDNVGCHLCWAKDPDAAWLAFSALPIENKVEDESHFCVRIARCGKCGQRYVSIFTETIDWVDGEDPQYTKVMPVTDEEASSVAAAAPVTPTLDALAPTRRSLHRDFPKDAEVPTNLWGTGLKVRAHS